MFAFKKVRFPIRPKEKEHPCFEIDGENALGVDSQISSGVDSNSAWEITALGRRQPERFWS